MEWLLIGFLVGLVMGLTGAGGGLISIPLFIFLLGFGLKQATVLSLFTVCIGALISWYPQRKDTDFRIAVGISVFSALSAKLFVPLKAQISPATIAAMLACVSLFSLHRVWSKSTLAKESGGRDRQSNIKLLIQIPLTGILVGLLTTLTGLGGGVILVPLLMVFFRMEMAFAACCSLFVIVITSLSSLIFQWASVSATIDVFSFLILGAGVILAALTIKFFIKKLPKERVDILRKFTFTAVVFVALSGIISSL